MSRNFELLQRAHSLMQRTALFAAERQTSKEMDYERAPQTLDTEEDDLPDSQVGILPCAILDPFEKRELLKLTNAVFRPGNSEAPRVVAIAGIDEEVSSARVAACAGELLANQISEFVCVVDADGHRGQLHRAFGLSKGPGLCEAVQGDGPIRRYCTHVADRLWVLRLGSVECEGGLALNHRAQSRIDELRKRFGYSLVVTSSFSRSPDVLTLAQLVDGVLLVLAAHETRRDAALAAKNMLSNANIPILGAVLSNRQFPIPAAIYNRL